MLQKVIFFTLLFSSTIFFFLNHPLSMNTNLMLQTFLIMGFSGLMIKSFWFSYTLFLIFLGGMLILFLYMTAIASKEKFSLKLNVNFFWIFFLLFIFLIIFMLIFFNPYFLMNKIFNMETMKFKNFNFLIDNNFFMLNKIFNFPMNFLSIFLMIYLLLTLVVTMKISNISNGPMRTK
uniref:NADH dehydrogenase subunit 6 n=1 Tax=Stenochironomus zhengi TaxID=2916445 RepID=UPI001FAF7D92|nr:NADH dehydrogenase subunit 6 [Stenochironomus zhengi]UKO33056.1 NADH dehydrogenase subunit 6 [Stenochironomus zhengi]